MSQTTQTTQTDSTNNPPAKGKTLVGQNTQGSIVTDNTTVTAPNPELESLRQELANLKEAEKKKAQKDMTKEQKELEELKQQLHEMAKKPLLESKYFTEKDLVNYSHDQLKAMNDLLSKVQISGPPARGAVTPEPQKAKKPVGRWYDSAKKEWVS